RQTATSSASTSTRTSTRPCRATRSRTSRSASTRSWAKYGGKTRLTETGHPSDGGGRANFGAAQNYWNQYQTWANSNGGPSPFYFQFHDATNKAGDEGHFGISADGFTWKFNVAPAATTPAPTPSPTPAPTTTVPATTTPAPTTAETTPAPTNSTTEHNTTTPAPTSGNATLESVIDVTIPATLPVLDDSVAATGAAPATTAPIANIQEVSTSSSDSADNVTLPVVTSLVCAVGVAAVALVVIRNRRKLEEDKDVDFYADGHRDTADGRSMWQRDSVAVL
ncbi:hypothetical protein SPRG_20348, partial [Saprolegnia parasitica CBS 223.65]